MALAPVTNGKLATLATGTTATLTPTFPAAHAAAAGSLLLMIHYVKDAGALALPSGWTLVGENVDGTSQSRLSAWVKKAAGGEVSGTTPTAAAVRKNAGIWEFAATDVDTDGLIAAATTAFSHVFMTGSAVTTQAMTAIDPPGADDVYFINYSGFFATTGNAATPSTPFTKDLQDGINSGMASFSQATNPGSTGNTHNWTTASNVNSLLLAVPRAVRRVQSGAQGTQGRQQAASW